jgi:hypothetical protein
MSLAVFLLTSHLTLRNIKPRKMFPSHCLPPAIMQEPFQRKLRCLKALGFCLPCQMLLDLEVAGHHNS